MQPLAKLQSPDYIGKTRKKQLIRHDEAKHQAGLSQSQKLQSLQGRVSAGEEGAREDMATMFPDFSKKMTAAMSQLSEETKKKANSSLQNIGKIASSNMDDGQYSKALKELSLQGLITQKQANLFARPEMRQASISLAREMEDIVKMADGRSKWEGDHVNEASKFMAGKQMDADRYSADRRSKVELEELKSRNSVNRDREKEVMKRDLDNSENEVFDLISQYIPELEAETDADGNSFYPLVEDDLRDMIRTNEARGMNKKEARVKAIKELKQSIQTEPGIMGTSVGRSSSYDPLGMNNKGGEKPKPVMIGGNEVEIVGELPDGSLRVKNTRTGQSGTLPASYKGMFDL